MKKATVYTDGAATLYHADFLDAAGSIQDNSIDFVFTDPPFELTGGGMKHSKLSYQGGEIFCKNGFSTKGIEFQKWVPEIYRVLKHGRYFYVMSNDRNLFSLHAACMENHFQFCELLVMDKKMTVPSTYYPKRAEFILMYRKGNYRKTRFCGSTIIETKIPRGKEKRHPTEKPVSMIEHFINCSTLENEIFLIPCSVNGSVLRYCPPIRNCTPSFTMRRICAAVRYAARPLLPAPTGLSTARTAGSGSPADRPPSA